MERTTTYVGRAAGADHREGMGGDGNAAVLRIGGRPTTGDTRRGLLARHSFGQVHRVSFQSSQPLRSRRFSWPNVAALHFRIARADARPFPCPPDQIHRAGRNVFHGVPPLAIEILSPSTEHIDRTEKRDEYALLGIGQYWLVDFPNRAIEIYRIARLTGRRARLRVDGNGQRR